MACSRLAKRAGVCVEMPLLMDRPYVCFVDVHTLKLEIKPSILIHISIENNYDNKATQKFHYN